MPWTTAWAPAIDVTTWMPWDTAKARMRPSSVFAPLPDGVLMMRSISLLMIRSIALGRP